MTSKEAFELAQKDPYHRRNFMRFITESATAVAWAIEWPMDRKLMKPLVTESWDALKWAVEWPTERKRISVLVTCDHAIEAWLIKWPEDTLLFHPPGGNRELTTKSGSNWRRVGAAISPRAVDFLNAMKKLGDLKNKVISAALDEYIEARSKNQIHGLKRRPGEDATLTSHIGSEWKKFGVLISPKVDRYLEKMKKSGYLKNRVINAAVEEYIDRYGLNIKESK